jgi:hypothetical protein
MRRFVDGNVYIGFSSQDIYGVKRYLSSSSVLEDKYWITRSDSWNPLETYFNVEDFCSTGGTNPYRENEEFCGYTGTHISYAISVLGQRNMVVAGSPGAKRSLWQYYPTVEKANSTVRSVTLAQGVISNVILAGTNAAGTNLISVYDTSSKQETIVLDASNEIEAYSITYVASRNSIMFTGLRFSDNKYVVGEISLS